MSIHHLLLLVLATMIVAAIGAVLLYTVLHGEGDEE